MKNSNDTFWNRTSDFPICSTAPYHCATAVRRCRVSNIRNFGVLTAVILKIEAVVGILKMKPHTTVRNVRKYYQHRKFLEGLNRLRFHRYLT